MSAAKIMRAFFYTAAAFLFIWFFLLKIVSRIAARLGHSAPCPATLAWIVDNPLRHLYTRPVLGWVAIQPGESVLELGPGPGSFTVAAARQAGPNGRLVAVDIQPEMIALVQRRIAESGLKNVETHVASADQLPIPDGSIDRAFLISVLPEIPNQTQALAELKRVLRSDGLLSITAEFFDPDYPSIGETVRLLEQNGFTLVAKHGSWWCYTVNFRPASSPVEGGSYYLLRKGKLLREFDQVMHRSRPLMFQRYGQTLVSDLIPAARSEFERLIAQIPYIGGKKNRQTANLVGSAWILALYRALQIQGKSTGEAGILVQEIYRIWLDKYPRWLLRLRGWRAFFPLQKRQWARHAQRSQLGRYSGEWVCAIVDDLGYDFSLDYSACGIYKFYQAQQATELMPYLCDLDFILSERLGAGLVRTTTLAGGGTRCDFRYKRGGPTVWPANAHRERMPSMPEETVNLLCHPDTGEPLCYEADTTGDGRRQEWLVAASGQRFPVEEGIPIFIQPADIRGLNQKYQRFYQLSAPFYDFFVWLYSRLWAGTEQQWRQEFLQELEINPEDKVLEVSVGTGGNLRQLPETADYFGLDITKGMLRQCRRNLHRWGRHAFLFNGNGERLPFKDARFDVVFHVGGINFFNDQEAAIQEMIRVAKPQAKILIVDETVEGVRQYEKMPGLRYLFRNERQAAKAPVDLVPPDMLETRLTTVSQGAFYCLTFRKPPIHPAESEEKGRELDPILA